MLGIITIEEWCGTGTITEVGTYVGK